MSPGRWPSQEIFTPKERISPKATKRIPKNISSLPKLSMFQAPGKQQSALSHQQDLKADRCRLKTTKTDSPASWAPPQVRLPSYGQNAHRSEEHTPELQSQFHLVCPLLLQT